MGDGASYRVLNPAGSNQQLSPAKQCFGRPCAQINRLCHAVSAIRPSQSRFRFSGCRVTHRCHLSAIKIGSAPAMTQPDTAQRGMQFAHTFFEVRQKLGWLAFRNIQVSIPAILKMHQSASKKSGGFCEETAHKYASTVYKRLPARALATKSVRRQRFRRHRPS